MMEAINNKIWEPQEGSQTLFLSCPIFEVLYEGTRGPGKTDALIMDFCQHVGQGYGQNWRGILFRQTYPQLADIVAKTKKWLWQIFPGSKWNASDYKWIFPDGEELFLRHIDHPDDYWNYHGHEYPWIGWEELTNWLTNVCYEAMMSCCRSSHAGMPRKLRATCNPYGIGHHWVKSRFIDPAPPGRIIRDGHGRERVRIHGSIYENKILLANDPDYLKNLLAITDENRRKAWLEGSWDIVAGGVFSDVWREDAHVIDPFKIPNSWRINRSFDWGSSKPFSVGWWAESDGTEATLTGATKKAWPRGTLFRIAELYGWNGKPNEGCRMLAGEIARKIIEAEKSMGFSGRVRPGPADSAIFTTENGNCIADDMARAGVKWEAANKSPGSRVNGWEKMKQMFKAATIHPMEEPGLLIFSNCRHAIRTLPVLPRDDCKPDDVNSDAEDHIADECRYRVLAPKTISRSEELLI